MRSLSAYKICLAALLLLLAVGSGHVAAANLGAAELALWKQTLADTKAQTPKWSNQQSDAFKASVDAGVPIFFLDVRTPEEWAEGIIQGATLVSLEVLATTEAIAQLPEDKSTIIGVYCRSGHRSALSVPLLRQLGYTNVISMGDGYVGWVDAGFPVVDAPK